MKDTLLQTPEGVRDIYGAECDEKKNLMEEIHKVLKLYSNSSMFSILIKAPLHPRICTSSLTGTTIPLY